MKIFSQRFPLKNGILAILIAFVFASCSTAQMTSAQKTLIESYSPNESMRIYLITNESDSVLLRTPSTPFNYKKDEKWIRQLATKMYKTVTDSAHMGVGIAAPQVGILKQMVLVQRFDKDDFPFEVYVNPKITRYSEQKQECREGCLSIPDFSAKMYVRAEEIDLEYLDIDGNEKHETVKGFTAVIFQHEIDHLNGILFIDHLKDESQYRMKKGSP